MPRLNRSRRALLVGVGLLGAVWLFFTPILKRVRTQTVAPSPDTTAAPVDTPDPVEASLRARVAAQPGDETGQLNLIAHLLDTYRTHEALAAARAAQPWLSSSIPLRLALGESLLRVGLAEKGAPLLRPLRASDEGAALLYAECELALGGEAEAVAAVAKLPPTDPGVVRRIVRIFARAGEPERAIRLLQLGLARFPQDAALKRTLSSALIQAGRYREAARLWAASSLAPAGAGDWYEIGVARLLSRDTGVDPLALSALEDAVEAAPDNPLYRHAYAVALLRDRQTAAALDQLKSAAASDAVLPEALADLAATQRLLGLKDAAAVSRARYLRALADPKAAVGELKSLPPAGPVDAAQAAALAAAYREMGEPVSALKLLGECKGDPTEDTAPLWEVYRAQTRAALYSDALSTTSLLAEVCPDDPSVAEARLDTLQALRRYDETREELEELQSREPGSARRAYYLGLFYTVWSDGADRDRSAERYFRRAIQIDPRFPGPRYRLGALYLRQERYREAIEQLRRSLGLSPSNSDALRSLAQAHRQVRENALADELFRLSRRFRAFDEQEEALLVPDRFNRVPLRNRLALADLYQLAGRSTEAAKQLEVYSHFSPLPAERRKTLLVLYGLERRYLAQAALRGKQGATKGNRA